MATRRIHIENLRIRLPAGMAGTARSSAARFGHEIMHGIADVSRGKTGAVRIDKLSAATIRAAGGEAVIRKRAAAEISAEVRKKLGSGDN
jgi:hypothetical protein